MNRIPNDLPRSLRLVRPMRWRLAVGALALTLAPLAAAPARSDVGERELRWSNGEIELAGALLVPDCEETCPGAVILQGSGASDRTNAWSRQWADLLVANGVAVLLTDKRGSGASGGGWRDASLEDLAADGLAGLRARAEQPEVDAGRVGLVGLSQGGHVASIAAGRAPETAFAINVSGGTTTMSETVAWEVESAWRAAGAPEEGVAAGLELLRLSDDVARGSGDWGRYIALRGRIEAGFGERAVATFPDAPDDPYWTWWGRIVDFDPLPWWRRVEAPVLFLYGAEDDNQPTEASAARVESLRATDGVDATLRVFDATGHALRGPDGALLDEVRTTVETWLRTTLRLDRDSGREAPSRAADWTPEVGPLAVELAGAGADSWAVVLGSSRADWVNDVVALPGGDFAAVGFLGRADTGDADWDGVVHRFDGEGAPVWTRRLGGPGLDALWSGLALDGGRLAAVGFSASGGAGSTDLWFVLLDASDGSVLVERWYGGVAADRGIDVLPAADGGFLFVGQTESSGAGGRDVYLVRTDAEGNEVWERTWGGPEVDRGFYGVATEEGGFVISGVTGRQDAYDMLVLKVDASGRELWHRVIGGEANDPNHGINLLPDGRVVVVGYTASWDAAEHDLMAVTLSPEGKILTSEILRGPGDDRVMTSLTAADGGTWLIGATTSFTDGDWNAMLARLDARGRFEPWLASLGTEADDRGSSLALAENGELILGGQSGAAGGPGSPSALLLARIDPAAVARSPEVAVRPLPAGE